ncbi:MAG: hypothetical protein KDC34_03630 [Saprospiraceae bacterium]|nr:hypothetical protein [Saprospiraceae bacterium]
MASSNKLSLRFDQFLEFFPEVALPAIFSDETLSIFSKENDLLPAVGIEQFIIPTEPDEVDDMTEYVPCARIPNTKDFHALVFWRARLMDYQFVLITYTLDGSLVLDREVIAGTYLENNLLTRSVATIDQDWVIYVVTGQTDLEKESSYDASKSKTFNMELLANGQIIHED